MGKVYAVTGATGYIGSKLLEHLERNTKNTIYAIVRESSTPKVISDNIKYVTYDGTEGSLVDPLSKADYLIHLGALYTTATDEKSTIDLINSNILLSTQLFNVANEFNKGLVIASSSTFSSLNEEGKYAPATLYAATKKAVENIAYYYEDLSIHFLTFPDTYGSGDWRPKIHNIVAKNKSWPFEFRSPAEQEMRILHVKDIIGHLLQSIQDSQKGVHIHDIYSEAPLLTLKELSELVTDNECLFSESAELTLLPKFARKESTYTGHINEYNIDKLKATFRDTVAK